MKLTQKYPLNWLGSISFEIKDSKIIRKWKALNGEAKFEYDFKNIDPSVNRYKQGNETWSSYIAGFAFIIIVLYLLDLPKDIEFPILILLILVIVFCFLMRMSKQEFVSFKDKNGNHLFSIRVSDSEEDREFAKAIIKKIKSNKN